MLYETWPSQGLARFLLDPRRAIALACTDLGGDFLAEA